ncbi:isocitrate lyase/phosphoenolpyruvate mutase family protein [Streptomyces sviceus]|uniref:isocitrate lyase/phosphoenolpyruvate mutase family protein n=1 Tax=Streptomyces sviceus TaxID=285530 RepID=UPI00380254FE
MVGAPVSADIRSGHARNAAGAADTVRAVLAVGAVGVNIEGVLYDAGGEPLQPIDEQAERITAAREAADAIGGPLNVMAGPGAPSVADPASLGVARVGVGSGIAQAAHALSAASRGSCWTRGRTPRAGGLAHGELNALPGGQQASRISSARSWSRSS